LDTISTYLLIATYFCCIGEGFRTWEANQANSGRIPKNKASDRINPLLKRHPAKLCYRFI